MPTPKDYLSSPREAELAELVWSLTTTLKPTGYSYGVHEFFLKIPWANRRIILARDFMTAYREMDGQGGIYSVNEQLNGTNFTAKEIANVEHFYVAALMGALVPNNPFWFGIMSSASLVWELVVGPLRIAWLKSDLPARQLFEIVKRNFMHNVDQYSNVDVAGLKFGEFYSLEQAFELFKDSSNAPVSKPVAPIVPVAGNVLTKVTVGPGDSLSLIAKRQYNDMLLWPVIYDANKTLIGPNPNRIKPGQVLGIPDVKGLTPAQKSEIQARGRNWQSYGR